MNSEVFTFQIFKNKSYRLELITEGTQFTIKLFVFMSKSKTDVYKMSVSSMEDGNLAEYFLNVQQLRQHLKDQNNYEMVMEGKIFHILGQMQFKKTKKIFQIGSIQLVFEKSIEADPEEQLINTIFEKFSNNITMTAESNELFEAIGICLNQLLAQRKVARMQKLLLQQRIESLEMELGRIRSFLKEKNFKQNDQKQKFKEQDKDEMTMISQRSEKFAKTISEIIKKKKGKCWKEAAQNQNKFQNDLIQSLNQLRIQQEVVQQQLSRLQQQNLNPKILEQSAKEVLFKHFEETKIKIQEFQKQINVLALRLQRAQKQLNIIKQKPKQTETDQKKINLRTPQDRKIEYSFQVDPQCSHFKSLVLSENIITAKDSARVFGKNKLVGQCKFTVTFTEISNSPVGLGVHDTQNKTKLQWGQMNSNRIFYWSNGKCWIDCQDQGNVGMGSKLENKQLL